MPILRLHRLQRLAGCTAVAVSVAITLLLMVFADTAGASASTKSTKATTKRAVAVPAPTLSWTTGAPKTKPPLLTGATAAYDPDNGTVVLFGGIDQATNTYSADTWVWNGANWAKKTGGPGARADASMAYDPALHQLVLYGGVSPSGGDFSDTWTWNGQSWYQPPSAIATCPPAREGAGLAYDQAGDLVLFGGTGLAATPAPSSNSPIAPGSGTTNTPASGTQATGTQAAAAAALSSTTTNSPDSACTTAQAGDPGSGMQVLGDTWRWNGTSWVAMSPSASPPALTGASLSYDSTDHTTVLFGGTTAAGALSNQTWVWTGATWQRQAPNPAPPGRTGALLADMPALSGDVLTGGAGAGGAALADTWVWSKGSWVRTVASGQVRAVSSPAGAYDAAESSLVVLDGQAGLASSVTELAARASPATRSPGSAPATPTPGPNPAPKTTTPTTAASRPKTGTPPSVHPAPSRPGRVGVKPSTLRAVPSTSAPTNAHPATPALTTSASRVKGGTAIRLAGRGFEPGAMVTITFHSKAYLVGQVKAGSGGDFSAYAMVPTTAAPGEHHFDATGVGHDGKVATLSAAVFVEGAAAQHGTSAAVKGVMFGLALLIPGAAWLAMSGARWRRRRRSAPAGA